MTETRTFSRNLNAALNERGLTAIDLARAIHVAQTTVYSWTQGKSIPRADKMEKVCRFLDIYPEELLRSGTPAPPVVDPRRYVDFVIQDDLMAPRLLPGDFVIADKKKQPENGRPALVEIEGKLACRILSPVMGGVVVSCLSGTIPPAFYSVGDPDLVIVGAVIEGRVFFE